ncbi:interleukin-20 receptor subunit alpha-like [Latimeria chalumnae]|uniref:interleukin-20 receptor subunit alpha-like n=1 Tax=Latimeria chalumnae TaxID=7897 RepID=UPI00313B2481
MWRSGFLAAVFLITLRWTGMVHSGGVSEPRDVHFTSRNFKNILQWKPGGRRADGMLYRVEYKIYGNTGWNSKPECISINRTSCDLSNETADSEEQYYARVLAFSNTTFSKWVTTDRFNPAAQTTLSPPSVTLSSHKTSILINLTVPEKWNILPSLDYKFSITDMGNNYTWDILKQDRSAEVKNLDHNTMYCVTAQAHFSFYDKFSQPSEQVCTTTPKDKASDVINIILFGCVLPASIAVFVLLLVTCFVYRYLFDSTQKQPRNLLMLDTCDSEKNVFAVHENITINFITLNVGGKKHSWSTITSDEHSKTEFAEQLEGQLLEVQHLGYAAQREEHSAAEEGEITSNGNRPHIVQALQADCRSWSNPVLLNKEAVEYGVVLKATDTHSLCGEREFLSNRSPVLCTSSETSRGHLGKKLNQLQGTMMSIGPQKYVESKQLYLNIGTQNVQAQQGLEISHFPKNCHQQLETGGGGEEETIVVDWDPHTQRLYIPNLTEDGDVDETKDGQSQYKQELERELLSIVYMKQIPETLSENEDICLLQFKEQWGLHVDMEA